MRALIIYDSLYGNTKKIAGSIGGGLGDSYEVTISAANEMTGLTGGLDLLLVGGPTHRHGLSDGMRELLDRLPRETLRDLPVAAFDTRYEGPGFIMGSAAKVIARQLKRSKAHLVTSPESFFVLRDQQDEGERRNHERDLLKAGEVERARDWGRHIATLLVPVG